MCFRCVIQAPEKMLTFSNSTSFLHVAKMSEMQTSSFFLPVLHELIEVFLHVLKDKIQLIVFSDNLLQLHHIGMVQLLKCLVGQKYKETLNN